MPNVKEIKNRINSVRDTRKITNAMYLIASTKLRKARADFEETRPYFNLVRSEIRRIFRTITDVESRYLFQDSEEDSPGTVYGILVITADKGLAGAYNMNAIRRAEKLMAEHAYTKLYVVGEYGRQYFSQHHVPIERSFLYTAQNPTMRRAREISDLLLEAYEKDELDKIFIIYTDMVNSMTTKAETTRLLPFHRSQFMDYGEDVDSQEYIFYPSPEKVLDNAMHSYIAGFVYAALVDSYCCEQSARMNAMQSANDNADELLAELSVEYNRVRQAAITQEITEVSAGAKAQKKKRQKKAGMKEVS